MRLLQGEPVVYGGEELQYFFLNMFGSIRYY